MILVTAAEERVNKDTRDVKCRSSALSLQTRKQSTESILH